jgi:ATP-binding cassette subfamily B protein
VPVPAEPASPYAAPKAQVHPDATRSWLRRALPLVLSHKALFLTSILAAFTSMALVLQLPTVLNHAVSEALVARTTPLSHYVWLAALLGAGAGLAGWVGRLFLMRIAYALEFDLRNLVYQHLSRMPAAFYDRHQSGQLMSRASSDIRSVHLYLAYAPFIVVQCTSALIAFAFMLTIDVTLALATMTTLPVVAWASNRMQTTMQPASWLIQSRLGDVATLVDESISGARVVKSFAAEDRQVQALDRSAGRLQWAYVRLADIRARLAPVVQNVSQLGMVTLLLLGGHKVMNGEMRVGAILAFASYVALLQGPFQMLGHLIMFGQTAKASARRVFELLDEQPTVVDRLGATELVVSEGEVRFEGVRFGYLPGVPVLDGFDLTLRRGETVALVGRTGSGKSTVSRLLTRAYDVQAGRITVDGTDVRDVTQTSLRAAVSVAMEEPFLFSSTVRDNIAYGAPTATHEQVEAAARAAGAHDFVSELADGYDTLVGERGYTLSGGQRQRIALARTLLVDAPVLVLDDATSSLDVEVEAAVHHALAETLPGRTVLVVAHRLSTIGMADRVVVLEAGRVVAEGTHAELLASSTAYNEVLAHVAPHEPMATEPDVPALRGPDLELLP